MNKLVMRGSLRVPKEIVPLDTLREFIYRMVMGEEDWATALVQKGPYYYFPRGDIEKIKKHFGPEIFEKLSGAGNDLTVSAPLDFPWEMTRELWENQKKWVDDWFYIRSGGLMAPCGSGKTTAAIALLSRLGQKTLILANTNPLANQWRKDILDITDISADNVGLVSKGSKEIKPITVATWQSFLKRGQQPNDLMEKIKGYFGAVMIDESHRVAAPCFSRVVASLYARYRFHATATPIRKDGKHPILFDVAGPIKVFGHAEKLIPVATFPYTGTKMKSVTNWAAMINGLTKDTARNKMVTTLVAFDVLSLGHKVLVISDRKAHCYELARRLERHVNVDVLIGGTSDSKRELIGRRLDNGELDVLVATKIMDEGLDYPPLSCIHLTCPSNNRNNIEQRTGRILRRYPNKPMPLIRDWIDWGDYRIHRIFENRIKWYGELGYYALMDKIIMRTWDPEKYAQLVQEQLGCQT